MKSRDRDRDRDRDRQTDRKRGGGGGEPILKGKNPNEYKEKAFQTPKDNTGTGKFFI